MKDAHFEALRLNVPLPEGHMYHDDGLVESIGEQTRVLKERYGLNGFPDSTDVAARYVVGKEGGITHHHVFHLELGKQHHPLQMILRGHEETHALSGIGRLDLLEDALLRWNTYMRLVGVSNQELVADIGGIHALCIRGIPPSLMHNYARTLGPSFQDAIDAYDEYRVSGLKARFIRATKALVKNANLLIELNS